MAGHRYWRLLFDENETGGSNVYVAEVEMRETRGGLDVCTGGTPSASSSNGSYPPANAFDNNASTMWASSTFTKGATWLGYDFGVGVTRNIVEVSITAWSGGTIFTPTRFRVQFSDDNSTWTTAWVWVKPTSGDVPWTTTPIVFSKATAAELTANYRYWRFVINNNGQNLRTGLSEVVELTLSTYSGGPDLTTPGGAATASSGSGTTGPIYAIDNNTSTRWESTASYWPRWWQYDLGVSPNMVRSFSMTATAQVGTNEPTIFDLLASNDATNWVHVAGYEGLVWGALETKTFMGAPAPLTIISITPNHGPAEGGTRVRIVHNGGI